MSWWQNFKNHKLTKQSIGLGAGEGVGDVLGLGMIFASHRFFPGVMDSATRWFARRFVEPHLETIEKVMSYFVPLEGEREPARRQGMTRAARAEEMAELTLDATVSFVPGWWAKNAVRNVVDGRMGLVNEQQSTWQYIKRNWPIVIADEGVHFGAIYAERTIAKDAADAVCDTIQSVLQKGGVSAKDARKAALFTVFWGFPNALGLGAAIGTTYLLDRFRHGGTARALH